MKRHASILKVLLVFMTLLLAVEGVSRWTLKYAVDQASFLLWRDYQARSNYGKMNWMLSGTQYHPFLTYSRGSGVPRMDSRLTKPRDEVFRVALLGSSFAKLVAEKWMRDPRLLEELKTLIRSKGHSGEIEIIDLTSDASRQPYQMLTSFLYVELVDLFISFEGVGELEVPHMACAPAFFPRLIHSYDPDLFTWHRVGADLARWSYGLIYHAGSTPLQNLTAYQLFSYWAGSGMMTVYRSLLAWQSESLLRDCDPELIQSAESESRVFQWLRFLSTQHRLLNAQGTKVVTFLHPLQYIEEAKILSPEEKSLIPERQSNWKQAAMNYSQAVQMILEKFDGDPRVVDSRMVFQGHAETLYIDECCHLNEKGNELYLEFVLDKLRESLRIK